MFRDYFKKNSKGSRKDYVIGKKACPNCGKEVSSLAVFCPYCKIDFRDQFTDERCGGCGQLIRQGDLTCPSCGFHYGDDFSANSEEVSDLCDKGFRYIEDFRFKDAKVCFNRASKLNPYDINPIVGNAYCLYHLGYYVLSLKKCDQALKMDAESIDDEFYKKVKSKAADVRS